MEGRSALMMRRRSRSVAGPQDVDLRPTALRKRLTARGYVALPDLGVSAADLDEVTLLLDGLYERYRELRPDFAHERALPDDHTGAVRLAEIVRCTSLEPRLLETKTFAAIQRLADQLLGGPATMVFDHALYKSPGADAPTPWHQDSAYGRDTGVGIWLPLQTTGVADGCLRYVPFSHTGRNRPHTLVTTDEGKEIWFLDERDVEVDETVSVPTPRGGVTAHHRRMVHGAWPNVGTEVRRAWIIVFAPPTPKARLFAHLRSFASQVSHLFVGDG